MNAAVPKLGRCATHRGERAGWQCTQCKKLLCQKCTATELRRFYCCECEALATQFTRPRTELSFRRLFTNALAYPVMGGPWRTVALALLLAVLARGASIFGTDHPFEALKAELNQQAPPPPAPAAPTEAASAPTDAASTTPTEATPASTGADPAPPKSVARFLHEGNNLKLVESLIRACLLLVFAFSIASKAAWGESDPRSSLRRLIQTLAATLVIWAPGAGYLIWVYGGPPDAALLTDWMFWLYVSLSLVYLPVCLGATSGSTGAGVFNPFKLFSWLWQVKGRYTLTVVTIAVLLGTAAGTTTLLSNLSWRSAFLREFVVQLLLCAFVAVTAHVTGALSFVHGYVFGWAEKDQFADPILPVSAEGLLKRWAEQREVLDARIRQAAENREAQDGARAPRAIARKIGTLLQSGESNLALKLYQEAPEIPEGFLKDEDLLTLGLIAQKNKKAELAQKILVPLGKKQNFGGIKARLALGQVLADSGKKNEAMALFKKVQDEFPKTDFARQAELKLNKLKEPG